MPNLVRKVFEVTKSYEGGDARTWTAPANVKSVRVKGLLNRVKIASQEHTIWLANDGRIYTSGLNNFGQLGDNSVVDKSTPTLITINNFKRAVSVAAHQEFNNYGGHMHVITDDGEVWAWGQNNASQLGDGTTIPKSTPTLIAGPEPFRQIAAGAEHCMAIGESGLAYGWGGSGVTTAQNGSATTTPSEIVGGIKWKKIDCSQTGGCGIDVDGKLYGWGNNAGGWVGDGTNVGKSSPVLIMPGERFIDCSHATNAAALTVDGDVYTWGSNLLGGLGDGTLVDKSSPVAVIGGHKFTKIRSNQGWVLALKENGEVWGWGAANQNQLGQAGATNASSPVLVSDAHFYVDIYQGVRTAFGITEDGSIYWWGGSQHGENGSGVSPNQFSSAAVQVTGGFDADPKQEVFITKDVEVEPGTTYSLDFFARKVVGSYTMILEYQA